MNTIASEIHRIGDEGHQNSVASSTLSTDDFIKKKLGPWLPTTGANVYDFVKAIRELADNAIPVGDTELRNKLDTLLGANASSELFAVAKVLVDICALNILLLQTI